MEAGHVEEEEEEEKETRYNDGLWQPLSRLKIQLCKKEE